MPSLVTVNAVPGHATVGGDGHSPTYNSADAVASNTRVSRGTDGAAYEAMVMADVLLPQDAAASGKTNYLDCNGVLIQQGRVLRAIGVPFMMVTKVDYSVFTTPAIADTAATVPLVTAAAGTSIMINDMFYKLTASFTSSDASLTSLIMCTGRDDKDVDEGQNRAGDLNGDGISYDALLLANEISTAQSATTGWRGVKPGVDKGIEHPGTDSTLMGAQQTCIYPGGTDVLAYFEATGANLSTLTAGSVTFYTLMTILESTS